MITGAQAHAEAQLKGRTPLSPRQFSLDFTQPEQLSTGRPCLHLWRQVDADFPTPPSIFVGMKDAA